ncbi:MAG: alpha-rhamnosidase [Ruminococcaceae bacterium]|nr:alpha-rhamnosidase [Oscillospiraceae bacterium]
MNKSYWIWHYGDYEIYHFMKLHSRRQEFGADYPAFWQTFTPNVTIKLNKHVETEEGYLIARANGFGYIHVDNVRYPTDVKIPLSAGKHFLSAVISNPGGLPALYIESDVCVSDGTWECNHNAGKFTPAASDRHFDSIDKRPDVFPFEYENLLPVKKEKYGKGYLYDFGKETFGYLNIKHENENKLSVYYGESFEEATDIENTLIFEHIEGKNEYKLRTRALRYAYIIGANENTEVSLDYEYIPYEYKGSFKCNEPLFEKIYNTCAYTFHLNCREGFFDGIKRDRWVWSGDAYQSARINAYLFADPEIVKRTAIGLAGKLPVEQHLNTIIDYTLLWIIGLYEFYMTYGDKEFLYKIYPMINAYIEFCEKRLNKDGLLEGIEGDWTFIDWSPIDKTGAVCAEQILLSAAYKYIALIDEVLGVADRGYKEKSRSLLKKINDLYWDSEKGAFIDSFTSGKRNVTRHANIFAIMYDLATREQTESILKNVLLNDNITKITTPYFEGYELDVLAKLGKFEKIEDMLYNYWGKMLELGATTIWEEFDPTKEGTEHYAMYGSRYGKSLCHAWGAGPIYLFGRYYLGVYPTKPGYESFNVEPKCGGLSDFEGSVPVKGGTVSVKYKENKVSVYSTVEGGTLIFGGKETEIPVNEEITL